MTTLRDLWISRNLTSTQVAGKCSITVATLYKLNRRGGEEDHVSFGTVRCVCEVLGISLNEFERLSPCSMSERYRKEQKS